MMVIKGTDQLFQAHNFLIVLRTPAQKRHKIHDRLCQESLFYQILIRRMAAALRKLMVLLIRDQRAVHIDRHFPTKGLIQTVILRRRGQIFIAPHHMGDPHQMIVHHICKIISGIAVRFDQNHIVQFRVVHSDIAIYLIMEGSLAFRRIVLADHIRHARCQLLFHFLFGQVQAMLIIYIDLLTCYCARQCSQPFLITETIIGFSLFHQHLRVLQIDPLGLAFTLHIRAHTAILVRPLIVKKPRILQRPVNDLYSTFHISLLIRILNTKDKISAFMLCDQIRI